MRLQKLFTVVHSLENLESLALRRNLKRLETPKSKVLPLYDALVRCKAEKLSNEVILKAMGMTKTTYLQRFAVGLLDRIIEFKTSRMAEPQSQLDKLNLIFHLDLVEYGNKLLVTEMERAQTKGNALYLLQLYEFYHEMKDTFRLEIDLPDHIQAETEVESIWNKSKMLKQMLRQLRASKNLPHKERQMVAQTIESRIKDWSPEELAFPADWYRARVRTCMLVWDWKDALSRQESLFARMDNWQQGISETVQEIELLLRLSLFGNSIERAEELVWILAAIQPRFPLENRIHKLALVRNLVFVGLVSFSENIISEAWSCLQGRLDIVIKEQKPHLILGCVQLLVAISDYEEAVCALRHFRKFNRKETAFIRWQINLYQALVELELGDIDLFDNLTRSAREAANRSGLEYPKLANSVIRHYFQHGYFSKSKTEKFLNRYDEIVQNPDEQKAAYYFDVKTWIQAKNMGKSQAEVERVNLDLGIPNFRMRLG